MSEFVWEARTFDGNVKTGSMFADSAAEVEERLRGMRMTPTKTPKKRAKAIVVRLPFSQPVPVKTKVIFTRQLATMIDAGLPLVQCLEVLAQQEPHAYFRQILYSVKQSVESGSTFAEALKRHPEVFEDIFVNLVQAGEAGGLLDTILNRLAIYMEKAMALRQRVKSAMRYPIIVVVAAVLITGVLLIKVIPSFAGIYKSMGNRKLPAITQLVIDMSDTTINYLPLIIGATVALIITFTMVRRTEVGRYALDKILLVSPVFGNLIKKSSIARFTRTLGTLIASGVPILDAMDIVARTSGNKVIERSIFYAKDRIAEGKSIASPLMEMNVFPKMVVQMIGVGENTGALDVMLTKVADFYEEEVDTAVDGLTSIIEPILMIGIGGIVAFVLIAMYMPIFNLADNLGGH